MRVAIPDECLHEMALLLLLALISLRKSGRKGTLPSLSLRGLGGVTRCVGTCLCASFYSRQCCQVYHRLA